MKTWTQTALLLLMMLGTGWAFTYFNELHRAESQLHAGPWKNPLLTESHQRGSFENVIDRQRWNLDFEPIEKRLWDADCSVSGQLIVDEVLESVLGRATAQLPDKVDNEFLQRVQVLAAKVCAEPAGSQLADLLLRYHRYEQALEQNEALNSDALTAEEKFRLTQSLQTDFFGETTTQQLFGRQQLFAEYLFKRQRVMQDHSLSEQEKQLKLQTLQDQFAKANQAVDPG